jgi:membrane protein YqaA with SNARE-associated domain
MLELLSLFTLAFLAATILPSLSEIYLISLLYNENHSHYLLAVVATTGNVLGAVVNWFLGRYLLHFKERKWFPIKDKQLTKATKLYNKWGVWSLLFAWMPIIGDALTLVAGVFKANIWLFLLLVTIGKASRYMAVLYAVGAL